MSLLINPLAPVLAELKTDKLHCYLSPLHMCGRYGYEEVRYTCMHALKQARMRFPPLLAPWFDAGTLKLACWRAVDMLRPLS